MEEISIKKIAEEAHVSTSLVSQVLNGRPVRVSQQTRERILSISEKYQYVPNKFASCLKSKQTHIIALLAPFTPNGFFSNFIYHVEYYANLAGYMSMVINTFDNIEREVEALKLFQTGMFDGMLVAPRNDERNRTIFKRMHASSFPLVFVDRPLADVSAPSVGSDHFTIGRELTLNSLAKGHRDIVYLYNKNDNNTALGQRRNGYRQAMVDEGLEQRELGFFCEKAEGNAYVEALASVLQTLERTPDVFFIHSGYYVPHLLFACKQVGFHLDSLHFLTVDGFNFYEKWLEIPDLIHQIEGRCSIAIQNIDMIAKRAIDALVMRLKTNEKIYKSTYVEAQIVEF